MQRVFDEIESGSFAREWQRPSSRLKFKAIRFFAMRQFINKVEKRVRKALGLREIPQAESQLEDIAAILNDPALRDELSAFEDSFEY